MIETKSYAIPGSPVSWNVLLSGTVPKDKTNSFLFQIDSYLADVKRGDVSGLSTNNALYHIEFGINDINTADTNYTSLESAIFGKYQSGIETVNFLSTPIKHP